MTKEEIMKEFDKRSINYNALTYIIDREEIEKILVLADFTDEEIKEMKKPKRITKWEDLGEIEGYIITSYCNIRPYKCLTGDVTKYLFATENQARSALAMSQLSQLMKHVNRDWKPDWSDDGIKYTIEFIGNRINTSWLKSCANFLSFPTEKIRDQFLEDHRSLIEDYFLMYK